MTKPKVADSSDATLHGQQQDRETEAINQVSARGKAWLELREGTKKSRNGRKAWYPPCCNTLLLPSLLLPIGGVLWGLPSTPGLVLVIVTWEWTLGMNIWARAALFGISLGVAFASWCGLVVLELGVIGFLFRPSKRAGSFSSGSCMFIRWSVMSALHGMALAPLGLITPSLFSQAYFWLMGCRIGAGSKINSATINDCFNLQVGEGSFITRGASINGHVFENGRLLLAPVVIGSRALIGTHSQICPGCEIGDDAVIGARSLLPKFTIVPPGEVWAGVPATCIRTTGGGIPTLEDVQVPTSLRLQIEHVLRDSEQSIDLRRPEPDNFHPPPSNCRLTDAP
mmetsp:Transcript_70969/g.140899  ORF Transcript_70969/g.140899 Transcript_70969/m.140899 type:complete len:340 (-) Transcript_70969:82-1101(-)